VTAQLDDVVFGADGLAPIVVQDAETKEVLMLAYGNREAVRRTIESNTTWFWSRSRGEYWNKGATSGNVQEVVEIRVDCDGDALLVLVDPKGPACHTGEVSCFFRTLPPSR
jgi:phosphoribosyl-AMP cyclohydrolase / phosphoribosyl-ATP pyrophosphohydrolase